MPFSLTLNIWMSTSLSFNLFGNVSHRKQTNQRKISDPQIIYDGALCDNGSHFLLTKQLHLRWWRNRILPLYAVIISFHDKIGSMGKKQTQRTQVFHILAPFFFSRYEEYHLLLPLLRNGCSLIDPFVFWRLYKVLFESIPLFWKYFNKL